MQGHGGAIKSVTSFSGEAAVTGGFDTAVIIWNMRSGTAQRVLRLHDQSVTALAAYSDSCALSGSNDGRVVRWCADLHEPPQRHAGHTSAVSGIAVSADRRWFATSSWDGTARLWPLAQDNGASSAVTGTIVAEHKAPVTGVAFGSDGRSLVTASYDGEVRAVDLGTAVGAAPRAVVHRVALPSAINGVAVLADGRVTLIGADGRVRVLARNFAPAFEVELDDGPLTALAATPDGRTIAVGGMRTPVTLIDADVGTVVRQISGPGLPIWALAFTGDGRELLTGGADGVFRRWRVADGQPLAAAAVTGTGRFSAVDEGAQVFRACVACHTTRPGEGHRAGPTLHGIFGRRIGTAPGYQYSDALKAMDILWTRETIARLFEIGPTTYTPGTKMPEQRITDPEGLRALIDWLERETRP